MPAHCNDSSVDVSQQTALVIDSGAELDKLLTDVLAQDNWNVEHAASNEDALELAKADGFDLIITGRKTRGPADVELLRKIRGARPHVRLIILTDQWTPGDVITAMREGAFSYFAAPFNPTILAETVRAAMNDPCWDDGIEVLSANPAWVRLMARCDIETANRIVQFMQGVRDPNIPEEDRHDVVTAFREILMNAMEHGGHFDPSQHVEISFVKARRAVICRVKDPGQGFSQDELRHAAITSTPEDLFQHMVVREEQGLRPGGFGMLMARKLVDELIYNEQGNDVVLVKYLDKAAKSAA
ncbi:MAG TPA: ATP-binding protein [Candidatus Acidoferrum sp.]|jgi:anti-sigma regulatory factor (Ser/Thr protein kinase)/CheY-like chemotaxis protein